MMLRRRATPIGQDAISAAISCGPIERARFVLASRHGEYRRTAELLQSIAAGDGLSPTEFSMSVHHALAGLLSIHARNRLGHIGVAAGVDSFAYGLVEAVACVAERPEVPVLLIYFDEPLPAPFEPLRDGTDSQLPLIVAVSLGSPMPGEPRIAMDWEPHAGGPPFDCAPLDFMRFLLSGLAVATSVGDRAIWRWRRAA